MPDRAAERGLAAQADPHFCPPRRQLTELRAADLRFTPAEAAEFHLWLTRLILHGIVG